MNTKICSKCKAEKSTEKFYKDCSKKDGLRSQCKSCRKKYDKRHYKENREEKLIYWKKYREKNPEKIKEGNKANYQKHREERLKYREEYYKKNREKCLEYHKNYYQENKEKILKYHKKYYQENKNYYFYHNAKRKAKKLEAMPDWTDQDLIRQFYKKAAKLSDENIFYHVDHIFPLQPNKETAQGLHVPANLQIIPAKENLSKRNKSPQKFYGENWSKVVKRNQYNII